MRNYWLKNKPNVIFGLPNMMTGYPVSGVWVTPAGCIEMNTYDKALGCTISFFGFSRSPFDAILKVIRDGLVCESYVLYDTMVATWDAVLTGSPPYYFEVTANSTILAAVAKSKNFR